MLPPLPPWRVDMRRTASRAHRKDPMTFTANTRSKRAARPSGARGERVAIERGDDHSHDHDRDRVEDDLLGDEVRRCRLHRVIDEIGRDDGEERHRDAEAYALRGERAIVASLAVDPGEADRPEKVRHGHRGIVRHEIVVAAEESEAR